MAFNYDGKSYSDQKANDMIIPEGKHKARIVKVVTTTDTGAQLESKNGNPMLYLEVQIAGHESKFPLRQYIVDNEYFSKNIGDIIDSCGHDPVATTNFMVLSLTGMVGMVAVKHEEYQGKPSAKIHYWVSKAKQGDDSGSVDFGPAQANDDISEDIPF